MISLRDLTRAFGSSVVVDHVTFDVARSEIVALLGPNGAGKTTTLRMLGGLIAPTEGSVAIDGVPMTRETGGVLRRRIGFLTEAPGLWDRLTVRENLVVYAGLYELDQPDRAVDRVMGALGLSERATTRAAELSKGLRQKVALARTLLHEPTVLLLDEPTSGLDPEVTRGVRGLLEERRRAGCAILISTHNLDEAERLADRVAVLQRRLLALDTPAELRRRLTTGRIRIRLGGDPAAFLIVARRVDEAAAIDGLELSVALTDVSHQTPGLVRALVEAGADVLEVRPEIPLLEDVYLHLMSGNGDAGGGA